MEKYPKEVKLKTEEKVVLRLLTLDDLEPLIYFFQNLSSKDRMFLRSDVMQKEYIYRRYGKMNYDVMFPLIALSNGKIVAIGTLFRAEYGWMRHLGELRCVVSEDYKRKGLCTILIRELFLHALSTDLYKIQAEIMEDQASAISAFKRMGFKTEAILNKHVTDINGKRRNLVIMSLDIQELWYLMEDFTIGKTYVV
ncbi:MAG: GNAT family N-acetyltransferase [Calditrichia bacterium]|jgi:RimJ/RimL family protein N-acetyltransferase